jgi:hypothetical protein
MQDIWLLERKAETRQLVIILQFHQGAFSMAACIVVIGHTAFTALAF